MNLPIYQFFCPNCRASMKFDKEDLDRLIFAGSNIVCCWFCGFKDTLPLKEDNR